MHSLRHSATKALASTFKANPAVSSAGIDNPPHKASTLDLKRFSFVSALIQVRHGHTDMEVPDFSFYRREKTKNASSSNKDSADNRKVSNDNQKVIEIVS